jgi:hypothetical protein
MRAFLRGVGTFFGGMIQLRAGVRSGGSRGSIEGVKKRRGI